MTTFLDLGLDFPLFAAPIEEANAYVGEVACVACRLPRPHGFELGVGDDLILACPTCNTPNALDADDREDAPCSSCGTVLRFPEVDDPSGRVCVCFECLRAGRAAFTQDTELGMVRWEDARRGLTHGVPDEAPAGFEVTENEDGWFQARLSPDDLLELVRTPGYLSWQGERWLFHHGRPMTFLGAWGRADFRDAAPDGDGSALFARVVEAGAGFWEAADTPGVAVFVFRCGTCGTLRGDVDVS